MEYLQTLMDIAKLNNYNLSVYDFQGINGQIKLEKYCF